MGVPSSAASYAAGQDLAPAALRSAGLAEQLAGSGLEVYDEGDLPHQVWRPDRDHPLAQNAAPATASLRQLAGDPDVLPPFARSIPRMLAATIH